MPEPPPPPRGSRTLTSAARSTSACSCCLAVRRLRTPPLRAPCRRAAAAGVGRADGSGARAVLLHRSSWSDVDPAAASRLAMPLAAALSMANGGPCVKDGLTASSSSSSWLAGILSSALGNAMKRSGHCVMCRAGAQDHPPRPASRVWAVHFVIPGGSTSSQLLRWWRPGPARRVEGVRRTAGPPHCPYIRFAPRSCPRCGCFTTATPPRCMPPSRPHCMPSSGPRCDL